MSIECRWLSLGREEDVCLLMMMMMSVEEGRWFPPSFKTCSKRVLKLFSLWVFLVFAGRNSKDNSPSLLYVKAGDKCVLYLTVKVCKFFCFWVCEIHYKDTVVHKEASCTRYTFWAFLFGRRCHFSVPGGVVCYLTLENSGHDSKPNRAWIMVWNFSVWWNQHQDVDLPFYCLQGRGLRFTEVLVV